MAGHAKRRSDYTPPFEDFDEFLESRGIKDKIHACVEKRIVAVQLERRRKECGMSKADLARRIGTSRTQIDRILDPASQNISLLTLNRVAAALGKRVQYELVDL